MKKGGGGAQWDGTDQDLFKKGVLVPLVVPCYNNNDTYIFVCFLVQATGIAHIFFFTDLVSWKLKMTNERYKQANKQQGIEITSVIKKLILELTTQQTCEMLNAQERFESKI